MALLADMWELLSMFIKPKAAYLCARLGVADALDPDGSTSKSAEELAKELQVPNSDDLYRMLRIMGIIGLLKEHDGRRFSLAPLGTLLRTDNPAGMKYAAMSWNMPAHTAPVDKLYEALVHGTSGMQQAFGVPNGFHLFARPEHTEELKLFSRFMSISSHNFGAFITTKIDWSGVKKVVDLAGAEGMLIKQVLKAYPDVQGVNVDLPQVIDNLAPLEPEYQGRLAHVRGDFFNPLPQEAQGADVLMMKFIMHDWGDEDCLRILKNARAAVKPGGRIIILDQILPDTANVQPGSLPLAPFAIDLLMLAATTGGHERTMKQWTALFTAAGFDAPEVVSDAPLSALVLKV